MELTVHSYKPTGTLTYHSPGTRRFFTIKAKRLIRLARRVHDGRLFLPEIVALLQEAAQELVTLGGFLLLTDKGHTLLADLAWILSPRFAPTDLDWDVREKQRHRADPPERCTLCRVKLVWPAQIVWRRGLEVVGTSAPIGIQCLTKEAARRGWGKLHDLITEVRAITSTIPGDDRRENQHSHAPTVSDHDDRQGRTKGLATAASDLRNGPAPSTGDSRQPATQMSLSLPLFISQNITI